MWIDINYLISMSKHYLYYRFNLVLESGAVPLAPSFVMVFYSRFERFIEISEQKAISATPLIQKPNGSFSGLPVAMKNSSG